MARRWALLAAAVLVSGMLAPEALAQEKVRVAATAIVEHPALDAVRDGVREELEAQGWVLDETLEFTYESAQGQPPIAAQIARKLVGDRPDVIVPISTPSAQAVVAATKDIPVVFTAVTDPVGAGLVKALEKPGGNVTGISDLSPLGQHLDLMKEFMPGLERLGVPYNPGEANAVVLVELLQKLAPERGITIVTAVANRSADVQAAARSLVGKVDAIYVPTDNTVVSALEAIIAVGDQNDLPVFSGDTDSVERGALATVGFDYYQVGRQTGQVVARVLRGEKPGDIAVRQAEGTDLVVNARAAERFNLPIPPEIRDRASKIYE
jgi:putative ABC transport system substrate-binding protein